MDNTYLIGLEIAREEDMLLAGLRRYWGTTGLSSTASEAELAVSQDPSVLRTTEEEIIHYYGPYFIPAFKEMQSTILEGMRQFTSWQVPALFLTPEHLALITFKCLIPSAYPKRDHGVSIIGNRIKLQTVAQNIAEQTWQLLHYLKARSEHKEIWSYRSKIIKNWTAKKRNRFVKEVDDMAFMPKKVKLQFGIALLQCIVNAVKDEDVQEGNYFARRILHWDGRKRTSYIEVNPKIVSDMIDNHRFRQWLRPKWAPMICTPNPWTKKNGRWEGGYIVPGMQMKFIRPASPGYDSFGLSEMSHQSVRAINALQNTKYKVNNKICKIMNYVFVNNLELADCPRYSQDDFAFQEYEGPTKTEEGKYMPEFAQHLSQLENAHKEWAKLWADRLRMIQRLDLAKDLLNFDCFYLPITVDFRGRCYTSTEMLSPQGSDFDKALCCFAEGKPYDEAGRYWMKVQIANLCGEDKLSFDDRVKWFHENEKYLKASAQNPIDNTFWSKQGDDRKKWQLLASLLDYYDESGMNHVAVQMDGSCNGIQHWSAIGRDPVGARATNLIPVSQPCDLYTEVADAANKFLSTNVEDDWHTAWREERVSRKCAKRPCMTYAYGVTLHGCVRALKEDGHCDWAGENKGLAAKYIGTVLMNEAIPSVVSASYQFMAWAKELAKQVNEAGDYLEWETPIGNIIRHNYYEDKKVRLRVDSQLVVFSIPAEKDAKLSTSEMISGIAPNFIHSLDASHMLDTINRMYNDGISSFSMIHDSFGCHANEVPKMHKHIRESFVEMYDNNNPSLVLAETTAKKSTAEDWESCTIHPPSRSSLDIHDVLQSEYFFS